MTSDQILPCTRACEHGVQSLQWVERKSNLTAVSELRLVFAAHSMNVAQIKRSGECPPRVPALAEKTQSSLFSKQTLPYPAQCRELSRLLPVFVQSDELHKRRWATYLSKNLREMQGG